jgi:hypothetical protein
MDIKHLGAKEYCRGELFRLSITLDQTLAAGDELYAELQGSNGAFLKTERSIRVQHADYLIDGIVLSNAPFGFYKVLTLEIRRSIGGGTIIPLEIPPGEPGINVVASKPRQRLAVPKVVSLG